MRCRPLLHKTTPGSIWPKRGASRQCHRPYLLSARRVHTPRRRGFELHKGTDTRARACARTHACTHMCARTPHTNRYCRYCSCKSTRFKAAPLTVSAQVFFADLVNHLSNRQQGAWAYEFCLHAHYGGGPHAHARTYTHSHLGPLPLTCQRPHTQERARMYAHTRSHAHVGHMFGTHTLHILHVRVESLHALHTNAHPTHACTAHACMHAPGKTAATLLLRTSSGTLMYLMVLPRTYASGILKKRSPSCTVATHSASTAPRRSSAATGAHRWTRGRSRARRRALPPASTPFLSPRTFEVQITSER